MSNSGDDKKRVRAERRRRVEPAGSGGRERAEAPARRRTETQQPTARPSTSTTSRPASQARPTARPSGGAALPSLPIGRLSPIMIVGLLVLACICIGAFMLLSSGGDDLEDVGFATLPPAVVEPTRSSPTAAPARPTNTPKPFVPPPTSGEENTWLVMLYQDADDKILEQDIYVDLNEAERVGSSDRLHIVAQVDRFRGGYQGDGNWSSTRRYYITQDTDLSRVNSQMVADLGEANMSDGETLIDFVTWAVETFPADKHVLILSDHGMGWPGGWSDADSGVRGDPGIPLAARIGDQLYLHEIDETLQIIRDRTGIGQFEMIGLDACLMGHVEVFAALAPHARYAVASQETEPALGWAYTSFLDALARNPGVDGAGLGQLIVDSYIDDDQRIVDAQARAELLRGGSPMGGLFGLFGAPSAAQLAQQMGQGITLTAVDLAAIPGLVERIDELAYVLQGTDQATAARARTYAQSFTSVWGKEVPPSYLDLGSLVQLLERESGSGDVRQAAGDVLAAIDQAVIAEKHGSKKPGATGISIYFPNSQIYASPLTGPQSYTAMASRFAAASLWDDFLAYHYAGRRFERDAAELAAPEAGIAVRGPGAGEISLSPLTLSSEFAAPGLPMLLSSDVEGDNVGYAYLFVGYYDAMGQSIQVVDRDYLESGDTRESDGIYYPVWPAGGFTLEFEWEPVVFAIDDGVDRVVALFQPVLYGASFEEAVYTVDGIYTFADDGESRYARLYFSDGYLRQVYGFTGEEGTGSPREIIPEAGDQFTVIERWLDVTAGGSLQAATQEGRTLTFGDQMFEWVTLDAAQGQYVVGFVVEDLDGNAYEVYQQITVE
ncbi:MAG: hypothetical protein JXA93_16870 [Anaerolineae bacterium]|nr:hypothetical protein [Anaerolineae bacterium]